MSGAVITITFGRLCAKKAALLQIAQGLNIQYKSGALPAEDKPDR